ncbi:MAG: hypothetical protein QNK11_07000 [Legionella sp.]|nr:hypothetical protein [Legionella sp.]
MFLSKVNQKNLEVRSPENRVTFCIYCKLNEKNEYQETHFSEAIEQALAIVDSLKQVAYVRGDNLSHFIFQYFLMPKENSSFFPNQEDEEKKFEGIFHAHLNTINQEYRSCISIKQLILSEHEANYFDCMPRSEGNLLDFMKISAMIDNAEYNHLQLDTNTVIHDYDFFYDLTFGSDQTRAQFVANTYSTRLPYFSVNSKVVYLPKESNFTENLSTNFNEHLAFYQTNVECLSIYQYVFKKSLRQLGVLDEANFTDFSDETIKFFQISKTIFIRVLKSWEKNSLDNSPEFNLNLSRKGSYIKVDLFCFKYLLYKYSTPLVSDLEKHAVLFADISSETEISVIQEYFRCFSSLSDKHAEFLLDLVNKVLYEKPEVLVSKVRTILQIEPLSIQSTLSFLTSSVEEYSSVSCTIH